MMKNPYHKETPREKVERQLTQASNVTASVESHNFHISDNDIDGQILAALRTKCHRPDCRVKHRAKPGDIVKNIKALISKTQQEAIEAFKQRVLEEIIGEDVPEIGDTEEEVYSYEGENLLRAEQRQTLKGMGAVND